MTGTELPAGLTGRRSPLRCSTWNRAESAADCYNRRLVFADRARTCAGRAVDDQRSPMSEQYDSSKIKVLKGLEAVRKRPGMYIGDTDDGTGLHHMVFEVVDNSIDEALAGHADQVTVTIHGDGSVSVVDNGRGIPVGMHEEGAFVGRGRHDRAACRRQVRRQQLQGLRRPAWRRRFGGQCAVRAPVADDLPRRPRAPAGIPARRAAVSAQAGRAVDAQRGTTVRFLPSRTIFSDVEFHYDILAKRLRELSFLNSGVRIELTDERNDRHDVFEYEGGIRSFVEHLAQLKTPLHAKVIYFSQQEQRDHRGCRPAVDRFLPGNDASASPTTSRRRMAAPIWPASAPA